MANELFLHWTLAEFQALILILVRVAGVIFLMPVIGTKTVPNMVKVAMSLVVSLILVPVVHVDPSSLPDAVFPMAGLLVNELFLGLTLGLVLKLVFTGLQLAGQMIGFQMGFGVANIMDPEMGEESPVLAELGYLIALLMFLAINGHHLFFQTLMYSFGVLRPGEITLSQGVYQKMLGCSGGMFVTAVKLMAPTMAILLLSQVALGILAKAVPQMNLLILSFPLTICLGLFFFGLSLQMMTPFFVKAVREAANLLPLMIRDFKG